MSQDFQNSQFLPGDEADMRSFQQFPEREPFEPESDEMKLFVAAQKAAQNPSSPELQQKLYNYAVLLDKLKKGEITQFDFDSQSSDLDLTQDQIDIAELLTVEKFGGKRKLKKSRYNKKSRSSKRYRSRSSKRYRSRSSKRYRSRSSKRYQK